MRKFYARKWIWILFAVCIAGAGATVWYSIQLQKTSPQMFDGQQYATGAATIMKITPQGTLDNLYQSLVVLYDKPMVPLSSLDTKEQVPCPLQITPKIEGNCKRISSRAVEFSPKTNWEGATTYKVKTIEVKGLLCTVEKQTSIEFTTTLLRAYTARYTSPKQGIEVIMNFPVSLEVLRQKIHLMVNGKFLPIKVNTVDKASTRFLIQPTQGSLIYNQQYAVQIDQGVLAINGNIPMAPWSQIVTTLNFVQGVEPFQQVTDSEGTPDTRQWWNNSYGYGYDYNQNSIQTIPSTNMEFHITFSEDVPLSKDLIKFVDQSGKSAKYNLAYLLNEDKTQTHTGVKLTLTAPLELNQKYSLIVSKSANTYMEKDEALGYNTPQKLKITNIIPKSYNMTCLYTNNQLEDYSFNENELIKKSIQISPSARIASVSETTQRQREDCPEPKKGEFRYEVQTRLNPKTTYKISFTKKLRDIYGNEVTNPQDVSITTSNIGAKDFYVYSSLNRDTNVIPSDQKIISNIQTINLDTIDLEVCQMSIDQYIQFLQTNNVSEKVCSEYQRVNYPVKNHYWTLTPNKIDIAKDVFKKEISNPVVIVKAKVPEKTYAPEDNYGRSMQQIYLRENASIVAEHGENKMLFFVTTIDGKEILKDMEFSLYTRERKGNTVSYTKINESPIYNTKKQAYEYTAKTNIDLVVARDGEHRAIVGNEDQANNYDFNYVGGYSMAEKSFLYLYTDRPIYKPGDMVYYKGIGRIFSPQGYEASSSKQTLKMIDQNNGNIIKTREVKPDKNGNIHGDFVLPKDIKLGMYFFQSDGGIVVNMPIDIQEYKKPLFKTSVELSKSAYQIGDIIQAKIGANYYFGGKIISAGGKYSIQRQYYFFDAKDYSDYQFGQGYDYFACSYRGECQNGDEWLEEKSLTIDASGVGEISYTTNPNDTGHEYIYTLMPNIVDPQTQTVVGKPVSAVVHQTDGYVGIKVPYRSTRKEGINLQGIVLNRDAQPKAEADVEIKLIKQDRQAVKKQSVNGIYFTDYEAKELLVDTFSVKSTAEGTWKKHIDVKDGGQYRIEARYFGANKKAFLSSQDIYLDTDDYMMRNNDNSSVTEIMAESVMRKVGEKQTFTVQSPVNQGKMLVTIEKDDGILDYRVQDIESFTPTIVVPITQAYYPNIYTKVFLLGQGTGNLPIYKRALGMTKVNTSYKKLNIQLTTDKKIYKPGEKIKLTAKVLDAQGVPVANANASISVVDESLLALKGNPQKNPYTFFFDMKRYLGVTTYLSLWNLIEKIEVKDPTDGSKGGDGELNKGGKSKKKRGVFKDTAFWQADATSDGQGRIQVTTDALPDNLTTWNIEVLVNTSPETQIGVAQTTVITNKTIMIQENLPQVLGAGDRIILNPLITNKTGKPAKIVVDLKLTHAKVTTATKTIDLEEGASAVVPFEIKVDKLPDLQKIVSLVTIQAKQIDASNEDSVQKYLPIVPTSTQETTTTIGKASLKPEKETINLEGIENYPGQLKISYSPSLMGNILQSIDFLQAYPYGCLEQKTSAIAPVLLIKQLYTSLKEEYNLKKQTIQRREDTDLGYVSVSRDAAIQEYIIGLASHQNRDGGMVYWSDRKDKDPSDFWATSYLLRTINDLQLVGYEVPSKLISNMRAYLESERYRNKRPYCVGGDCAYDLQTRIAVIDALAIQSQTDYAPYKMRTLLQEKNAKELSNRRDLWLPQSLALVHIAQNKNLSKEEYGSLISEAKKLLQKIQNEELVINPRDAYIGKDAGVNRLQQTTQMLQAVFSLESGYRAQQETTTDLLLHWIISQKKQGGFGSTTNTMEVIKALISYLKVSPIDTRTRDVKVILNDKVIQEKTIKAKDKFTTYNHVFSFSQLKQKSSFALQATQGTLFYDLTLSYYLPTQELGPRDEGFGVQKSYYDYQEYLNIQTQKSQERTRYLSGEISYGELKYPNRVTAYLTPVLTAKIGQLLVVDNQIVATETRDQVMFEGFLPAGTQAINTSLATSQKLNMQASSMTNQHIDNGVSPIDSAGYQQESPVSTVQESTIQPKKNPVSEVGFVQINTQGDLFERVEFRDDRVMGYTSIVYPGVHHFLYVVRAQYAGEFGINPSVVSQIYTPEVFGRTAGQLMKIE